MKWLIAAYATVWIALFFYILGLDRKQRSLAAELKHLHSKLGR